MDTSNNQMNFSIDELLGSELSEERKLGEKAEQIIQEAIKELKPILRYVVASVSISIREILQTCRNLCIEHALEIGRNPKNPGNSRILFLGEDGNFFSALPCVDSQKCRHYHYKVVDDGTEVCTAYKQYPFDYLLEKLRDALKIAIDKREKHLTSILSREAKLDQILEILKK